MRFRNPLPATLIAAMLSMPVLAQTPAPPPAAAEAALIAGETRIALTPEELAALPATEATTSFLSSRGYVAAHYKGALLWDLLEAHGVVGEDVKAALRHTVLVSAADGHAVAFSVGELAPDFGNRPVILAWEVDGAPSEGGLRMVAPGDTRGARHVKQVSAIEYR